MSVCRVTGLARFGQCRSALLVSRRYKATAAAIQSKDGGEAVKPFSALPGPRGLPFIGTLFHTMRNSSRLHESIQERHETYGPIFREKLGVMDAVFLMDVDAVESLLRQDGKYPSRMQVDIWHEYRNNAGLRKGLLLNEGETWHALRRVVDRHMLKTRTVESYAGDFNMVVAEFLDRLDRILPGDKEMPSPDEELFNWSLESISKILYEKKLGCLLDGKSKDAQDFINSAHEIFATSRTLAFLPPQVSKVIMPKLYKRHMASWETSFRVGRRVAELEMQLLVSQIVRKYKLEAISKEPFRIKYDLLLLPKDPVRIRLIDRDSQ